MQKNTKEKGKKTMKFLFNTTATMKEYNRKKWWIDAKIIPNITIEADTIKEALKTYQKIVLEKHCITISDNAINKKNNMYKDTQHGPQQTGFVITGKAVFENNYKWTAQYIDLWVDIKIIKNPFVEV